MNNLKTLFSEEFFSGYSFIQSLMISQDEWKYSFMPEHEFVGLDDAALQAKIYWTEMLSRAHIVCLVSLFKAARWLEAIDNAYGNYFGFCSALRGFLESCADAFYTVRGVPLTIGRDYFVIAQTLELNSQVFIVHEKLENSLLHFIQATRLSKEQKDQFPKAFNAKQIQEYLQTIDDETGSIKHLYSHLCGITHPSCDATKAFLFLHKGETIVCSDSKAYERKLCNTVANACKEPIEYLFGAFMGNQYCTLNLLNQFPIKSLYTTLETAAIEGHPCWTEIQNEIEESKDRFLRAQSTGKYQ